jgi:hypothetical protein
MFAEMNARLHRDELVRFSYSDLLSGVSGDFDFVAANLWQPTDEFLSLTQQFLLESATHLSPGGRIVCWIGWHSQRAEKKVLAGLAQTLEQLQMWGRLHLKILWMDRSNGSEVVAIGALVIERAGKHTQRERIRTQMDMKQADSVARKLYLRWQNRSTDRLGFTASEAAGSWTIQRKPPGRLATRRWCR